MTNTKILLISLSLVTLCCGNQKIDIKKPSSCLYLITDTIPDEKYGYVNSTGDTVIPLDKYPICFTDTFCNWALVLKPQLGFVGINRQEDVLFNVFPFDNAPDSPSEGKFRIIEKDKIGYADTTGKVIILPKFGGALPFSEGFAAVCEECEKVQNGEHYSWENGKWGFIDTMGKLIINYKYEKVKESFKNGFAIVVYNGKEIKIDKNGNEI